MGSLNHRFIDSPIHWFIDLLLHSFIDSSTHVFFYFVHSFIHSCIHSFIRSLVHSFGQSVSQSASQPVSQSVSLSACQSFSHSFVHSFVRSFVSHGVIDSRIIEPLFHWIISSNSLIHCFIDWLIVFGLLIGWLIDWWLVDRSIDWLTDSRCIVSYWFIGSLLHWFIVHWFIDSLIYSLVRWLLGSINHRPTNSLIPRFLDSWVHWFFDSLVYILGQLRMDSFMSVHLHLSHHVLILWCTSQLEQFTASASHKRAFRPSS